MRRANLPSRFCQSLNFVGRPPAKPVPQWIIAAPKFLALATDQAVPQQAVIAALELAKFEPDRPLVVWASDNAAPPVLLQDLMRLFC